MNYTKNSLSAIKDELLDDASDLFADFIGTALNKETDEDKLFELMCFKKVINCIEEQLSAIDLRQINKENQ